MAVWHSQAFCTQPGQPTSGLVHFPREPRAASFLRGRMGAKLLRTRRALERGADALASADDIATGRLAFDATTAALEAWLGVGVGAVRRAPLNPQALLSVTGS